MLEMKRVLISLVAAVLLLGGCALNDYKKLEFKSYDVASITDFSYAKAAVNACVCLDLEVANPTGSGYELQSLIATLYTSSGSKFADAVSLQPAVLAPHSDSTVTLTLNTTIYNPLVIALSQKPDFSTMTADIDATVKSGSFTKQIKKNKLPLKEFLEKMGDFKIKLD